MASRKRNISLGITRALSRGKCVELANSFFNAKPQIIKSPHQNTKCNIHGNRIPEFKFKKNAQ